MDKIRIAIFASGSGSNAENIVKYFEGHSQVQVASILTNNPNAYVLERAARLGVESFVFTKEEFSKQGIVATYLHAKRIDFIVLAGFLLLVPQYLVDTYPDRIINIHPALLPDFGGKGMYGSKVHKAVVASGAKQSGITIHLVNSEYDKGKIIFQAQCEVAAADTPDTLAEKVHALEYKYFPEQIEGYVLGK